MYWATCQRRPPPWPGQQGEAPPQEATQSVGPSDTLSPARLALGGVAFACHWPHAALSQLWKMLITLLKILKNRSAKYHNVDGSTKGGRRKAKFLPRM